MLPVVAGVDTANIAEVPVVVGDIVVGDPVVGLCVVGFFVGDDVGGPWMQAHITR